MHHQLNTAHCFILLSSSICIFISFHLCLACNDFSKVGYILNLNYFFYFVCSVILCIWKSCFSLSLCFSDAWVFCFILLLPRPACSLSSELNSDCVPHLTCFWMFTAHPLALVTFSSLDRSKVQFTWVQFNSITVTITIEVFSSLSRPFFFRLCHLLLFLFHQPSQCRSSPLFLIH